MSRPVITFPPPPTHNCMSAEQRAQMIRTSTKLRQVLGSTPHVVDAPYSPALRVEIPRLPEDTPSRKIFPSYGRSKSLPGIPDTYDEEEQETSPISASSGTSSSSHTSAISQASTASAHSEHSWRPSYPAARPPMLKIVKPSYRAAPPGLSSIPGSPSAAYSQLPESPEAPTFTVPSQASLRRKKMRRLTRVLGDGVLQELVYPPEADVDGEDWDDEAPLLAPRVPQPGPSLEAYMLTTRHSADSALPSIPEGRAAHPHDVSAPAGAKQKSKARKSEGQTKGQTRRDAIADGRGAKPLASVCVGVSASAGMQGKGRSRRWVQGPIEFDQVVAAWR